MAKKMRTENITSTKFDTYSIIKRLVEKGFEEPQAKELVDIIAESREFDISHLATKLDLMEVKNELSTRISDVEHHLSVEIERVKTEVEGVRTYVEKSRVDFVKWQITTIIAFVATMIACFQYFMR